MNITGGKRFSKKYKPHNSTRYRSSIEKEFEKKLPELYEKRENCCGCSACYAICPTNAITMEEDEEGFFYPIITVDLCIGCYKCLTVCDFKKNQKKRGYF